MKLIATDRALTRLAVFKEVANQIQTCEEVRTQWEEFERWATSEGFKLEDQILVIENYSLHRRFLPQRPWAEKWLVEHGFAKEDNPEFKSFSITVSTREEAAALWHRLNQNNTIFTSHYKSDVKIFGVDGVPNQNSLWEQVNNEVAKQGACG